MLSKRLRTVAEAVTPGHRAADVGTDHGFVPIWLVKNGICPRALATDVHAGPLARAEEHIREEGLTDRIKTRCGDGLCVLTPAEADTVILAGMGGELICRILTAAPAFFDAGTEFVLQPQSEWFKVRRLLHDRGYHIEKEWFLTEDGIDYVVLKSRPAADGKKESYGSEFQYVYGACLLEERPPEFMAFLKREAGKKQAILSGLKEKEKEKREPGRYPERDKKNAAQRKERCMKLQGELKAIERFLQEKR